MSSNTIKSSIFTWERNPLVPGFSNSQDDQIAAASSNMSNDTDQNLTSKDALSEPPSQPFTMESLSKVKNNFKTECKFVSLKQEFDRTLFVAGREGGFQGRVVITVDHDKKVKLGRVYVEIVGFEGMYGR